MKQSCLVLQEVSQALHALATLRHRHARLLKALSAEAACKAPSANAIDVATCVWALGTLRHQPRPALAALTARMLELLPTFEPQVQCALHPPKNATLARSSCLAFLVKGIEDWYVVALYTDTAVCAMTLS